MTALEAVVAWLRCPVCAGPVKLVDTSLACRARHTFDVAKQGYVNLLGRSAPTNADTADMVAARHRFLSTGHYDPLTDAVTAAAPNARRVVEVGAGTGHHLARILDHLPKAKGLTTDISVPASRRAAKAHPRLASVVADTWVGLPLADGSVDTVVCIFAPRNPAEFARVLADDGVAIVVLPQPHHLQELREAHGLLAVGENKVDRLLHSAAGHLELVARTDVAYALDLTDSEATDLVAMGPNAFHSSPGAPATNATVSVTCITLAKVGWPHDWSGHGSQ